MNGHSKCFVGPSRNKTYILGNRQPNWTHSTLAWSMLSTSLIPRGSGSLVVVSKRRHRNQRTQALVSCYPLVRTACSFLRKAYLPSMPGKYRLLCVDVPSTAISIDTLLFLQYYSINSSNLPYSHASISVRSLPFRFVRCAVSMPGTSASRAYQYRICGLCASSAA